MIEHYNAFISYKHANEDIKVAEAVQHCLEHYHIPSNIRKKTGMKRIERIFRDKEELPITSDLSENIAYALEHSDYLIVICSTNTKQSVWVPREIDYFLRNHTRKQILTVLVNGEPQDVIPDILLHEDKIITDENGQQRTVRVPLEPLSCDYRDSIKKANKDEIPRLASALIGCSYDELMNRQRQYKMKRMVFAFSLILALVLAFAGQMIYSRYKIKKNYLDSLKNQSKYLANESEYYLEKEQRIKALQLAIASLPKDEYDNRPVTAEDLRALTDATLAYKSLQGTNIYATWNYTMPHAIKNYTLSPESSYLAALDYENCIKVWEVSTHNLMLDINLSTDYVYGYSFLSDDKLVLWTPTNVYLYNLKDGSTIWTCTLEEDSFKAEEIVIDGDGNILLPTINSFLTVIDSTTGNIKDSYILNENDFSEKYDNLYCDNFVLSPDKKTIAFAVNYSVDYYFVGTFDLSSKKAKQSESRAERIKKVYWADDTHIMAAYSQDDFNTNVMMDENSYLSTDHTYIQCLTKNDLKELWNYDFTSNEVNLNNSFLALPKKNSVAFCNGNMVGIFDVNNGNLSYLHNVNSSIVDISDRDSDGWPVYITYDGCFAVPFPSGGMDSLTLTHLFTNDLDKAIVNNGVYVHQKNSKEIIYYSLYVYDTDWQAVDEDLVISSAWEDFFLMEDSILSIVTSEDDIPTLTIINPETNEVNQIALDYDSSHSSQYTLLGSWKDKLYLAFTDYINVSVISIDLSTMNVAKFDLQDSASMNYVVTADTFNLTNGKIIYYVSKNETSAVAVYDIDSKTTKSYVLPDDCYVGMIAPHYIEKTGKLYISGDGSDCIIDMATEKVTSVNLPDAYISSYVFAASLNGKEFAVSDNSKILMVNDSGNVKFSIPSTGTEPIGMTFYDNKKTKKNELFVLYANGNLYRYNTDDGSFIGMSDVTLYQNYAHPAKFKFDYDNNLLYIQSSLILDIIDLNSMIETTCIENCLGHNIPTDRFYTLSYTEKGKNHIGYFKHYTLEELIQKGKDILQGAELSDEDKSPFGIE
ncbi:MAG: TIR domain-containing protein [Lachnospiraceae bacterium]|nr:TIR domain-containing protein [Lachnospiraceae bacterium]